jgi:hypothetical protein
MKSVVIITGVLVKFKDLGGHALSTGKAIATSEEPNLDSKAIEYTSAAGL